MSGPVVPGYVTQAIAEADSLESLHRIASRHLDDTGFSRFAFHLVRESEYSDRVLTILTDYPDEWIRRYTDRLYLYNDPVHNHSLCTIVPFTWSSLRVGELSKQSKLVFDEASEFRLQDGISVPVRGHNGTFSVFSAVADGTAAEQAEALKLNGDTVAILATLVHQRATQLIGDKGYLAETQPHLTPREREVMKWVASGKITRDIGDILKIGDATVSAHVDSAMRKLNATTRSHAAVLAVLAGLIDPV